MSPRVPLLLAVLLVLGGAMAAASGAQAPARATATATLVAGTLGEVATLHSDGDDRSSRGVRADRRGVKVASGEVVTEASRRDSEGRAEASVAARSVTLLDGLVTAYGLRRRAVARDGRRVKEGRVEGLAIDGRMIGTVDEERFYEVGDVGTLAVNRGASALKVHLDRAANGFPAGTTVTVGRVTADASDGATPDPSPAATPTPTPTPSATPDRDGESDRDGDRSRRGRTTANGDRPRVKRRRAPKVDERLTGRRFAFPVYGKATIGGPFASARVGHLHQGNDIFAPFGAPVLAVTDGEVFKVGTKVVSGNRLWLRSKAGDEFFYAHLSAFSPAAVNGRQVRAGEVLGFTGNTGNAEPTPPHVHFEVHPSGGKAIDPRPFLLAWRDRRDVPPGAWLTRMGSDTEERPGALVEVRDFISGE